MALDEVRDFLHQWPGWATLAPDYGDISNTLASGETRVWELRDQLWRLHAETSDLKPTVASKWEAVIESLQNGKRLFWGYDLAKRYPTAYPNGAWPTGVAFNGLTATLGTLDASNHAMTVDDLPAGFVITEGDMLQIDHAEDGSITLVRALETATANGSGLTPEFEFHPHVPDGVAAAGDLIAVKRPACRMIVIPGSFKKDADRRTGRVRLAFDAIEALEVPA